MHPAHVSGFPEPLILMIKSPFSWQGWLLAPAIERWQVWRCCCSVLSSPHIPVKFRQRDKNMTQTVMLISSHIDTIVKSYIPSHPLSLHFYAFLPFWRMAVESYSITIASKSPQLQPQYFIVWFLTDSLNIGFNPSGSVWLRRCEGNECEYLNWLFCSSYAPGAQCGPAQGCAGLDTWNSIIIPFII